MKRSLITALAALLLAGTIFAGGIVTNTNQSAMYTRMAARHATLGIDAVYYNPAGLTKLGDGFHFSINNQTLGQTRTITTNYNPVLTFRDPLNKGEFIGDVSAPIFPGVYGVFKMGKWAFSLGFNPIGGGGGATYNSGLPSFEYPIADIPAALFSQGQDVRAYRSNAYFEGSSIFFGYQANISYAINDMISVALGARYITAKETYKGHLKDIEINAAGTWTPVPDHFTALAAQATGAAAAATGASGLVAAEGSPGDPLTNATAIGALTAFGVDPVAISNMTNAVAIGTLDTYAAGYTAASAQSTASATLTGILLADQNVEAEKTGSGITPIVSVNIQPIDMLNISVRYEHATKLELTTASPAGKGGLIGVDASMNPVYMFTDGEKTRLDMPGMLAIGATLRPIEKLLLSTGFTSYFDKGAVWGTESANRTEDLSGNSWDIALGAEYGLSDKFLLSGGWSMTSSGATPEYQTDLSYSLSTNGISAGFAWNILPILQLNLGGQYVIYTAGTNDFQHNYANSGTMLPISEKLEKSVWIIAAGVNISIARGSE
ncbi:OmpP1/FadL family transporter [Bacteroidota bacterium]